MTRRHISIDLGPMSLPFFEQSELSEMKLEKASKSDIEKLHALLRDGNSNNQELVILEEQKLNDIDITNFLSEIEDGEKVYEISKAASEAVMAIHSMDSKSNLTTANLKIREALLPDTTITAKKINNHFYFDLFIGDEVHRQWLIKRLPLFVRQIGERINCPLEVSVFDPKKINSAIATQKWPDVEPS